MAETSPVASKNGLDDSTIQCLKDSVITTFSSICGLEPVCNSENANGAAHCDGIVGIISIVGEDSALSLMLGFPRDSATAMAMQFAGFEIPFDSSDMGDVIGELANVLAGDAVARLQNIGMNVEMSLPTVVRGSNVELLMPGDLPSSRIQFELPDCQFWLKIVSSKSNQHHIRVPGS